MPGIQIEQVDGLTVYTLSQSWINSFMNCPEQARLEMNGLLPRKESDATAIGTALHSAIEDILKTRSSQKSSRELGVAKLQELIAGPTFQWVQIKTEETAIKTFDRVFDTWMHEIFPQLPTTKFVEYEFDVVLDRTDTRLIRLKGAMDFVDEFGDIWDWKTSNRPYEQWQVDRFKIQPTAYTLGLSLSTTPDQFEFGDEMTFHYAVMFKSKPESSIHTTTRNAGQWNWLVHQCKTIIDMVEADLKTWPMNDQHALCSPTWCTAWDSCKGLHVDSTN